MKIFRDSQSLRKYCDKKHLGRSKIALVPTMGYLHEGHLSLIEAAKKKRADEIIVSIFVNPVQFGPGEDFEKYPRDEKSDLAKCRAAGATAVFIPDVKAMYAVDHSVYVDELSLSNGLCGAKRPGHFRGVCTVVAKLFNITRPDFAVFGQKDYQQSQIIKRMVRDLDFGIDIIVSPIVREKSGLAKSSRNTYLSEEEKEKAVAISKSISTVRAGERVTNAVKRVSKAIESVGLKVDYVNIVDGENLLAVKTVHKGDVVLCAAFCGVTRLIDNHIVNE
jgi:pantoate--beta-alanine ligase